MVAVVDDTGSVRPASDRVVPDTGKGAHRHRKSARKPLLGWIVAAFGLLILLASGWVAWRSYSAYSHLTAAASQIKVLETQLTAAGALDPDKTAAAVSDLRTESDAARDAVNDPLYRATTVLPWVGGNLDAVREIALTVDSISTDAIPGLVDVVRSMDLAEFTPQEGVVNLAPIQLLSPLVQNANTTVQAGWQRVADIDRDGLVGPVHDAVLDVTDKLAAAASMTATGARAVRLLPPMLGAGEMRTYLVVFQNLAEQRATGGIFGSYARITIDQGRISMADHDSVSRSIGIFDAPVTELTPDQLALYTAEMAQYPQDVNLTPDFPVAAELFADMYTARTGTEVNGVIAIDPVALSYMLQGAGPIDVGSGVTITADTVVQTLLSNTYEQFADEMTQGARDEFLGNATATVFNAVLSGGTDSTALLSGLSRAVDERRLLVWSSEQTEQADLAASPIAGSIATSTSPSSIGLFLNDGTGAKLGYYLTNGVTVTPGACQADGRRQLTVTVTMNYAPPTSGLPSYVLGTRPVGTRYAVQTNVLLVAPAGGSINGLTRDGRPVSIPLGSDGGREIGTTTVLSEPGAVTTLEYTVTVPAPPGAAAEITPALELTPGVRPWQTAVDSYLPCAGG